MARYFTLDDAEALLPLVAAYLEDAIEMRDTLADVSTRLERTTQQVAMSGGMRVNRMQVLSWRDRQEKTAQRLRELIQQIHSHGCQVKDLELGLLDFPTLYRGEEVQLCWKRGETSIQYWHGASEGFRSRKEIDREFRENHRGDSAA